MSAVIYKYQIEVADYQEVKMPLYADILSFQVQNGNLVIWVKVYPHKSLGERVIHIVGTGHDFQDVLIGEYVGTVQWGGFVWHCFDGGYCT